MPAIKKPATAYRRIARTAEAISNAEPAAIAVMDAGDVVRQGDLYLVRLDRPIAGRPYGSRATGTGDDAGLAPRRHRRVPGSDRR